MMTRIRELWQAYVAWCEREDESGTVADAAGTGNVCGDTGWPCESLEWLASTICAGILVACPFAIGAACGWLLHAWLTGAGQ